MRAWIRYALFALVLAVPASAYAYHELSSAETCPPTPDCPCD